LNGCISTCLWRKIRPLVWQKQFTNHEKSFLNSGFDHHLSGTPSGVFATRRGAGRTALGGAMSKLFGDNQAFSAGLEMQVTDKSGQPMTMPGKLSFDTGKSRFEVNMADMKGGQMPPNAAAQMKSMGMDQMVTIARPDKKAAYLIYPGMQSYAEIQLSKPTAPRPTATTRWKSPKSARRPWTAIRA
jgi:hypothetical protein